MNNRYKNKYVFDYIRSGVDTSFFKPLGFEKKNNIVLYVGRLIERKGISKIIELSKLLPDIHFNFIGSGALASKIVGSNIRCLGFVDDMNKHYNEADVCLFPSASENLPLVGLESLSCGTPVISTHMGFEEYINHNENGIIIDNTDLENMKSAILEVLSNTNLRNRIIDNGLKTAKAFDWNNMILGYEKKLLNVLKNA